MSAVGIPKPAMTPAGASQRGARLGEELGAPRPLWLTIADGKVTVPKCVVTVQKISFLCRCWEKYRGKKEKRSRTIIFWSRVDTGLNGAYNRVD